ncbi:MAG TPA: hypothetical protein VJM50_02400 [Pyrinomonadaceae bacterium]|nr:hypothetical protein [Pyrinomonadaceae bacterium]
MHQSPVTTLVLTPEGLENEGDRGQIEERVKALTGRSKFEVVDVRPTRYPDGRVRSFEVDIR